MQAQQPTCSCSWILPISVSMPMLFTTPMQAPEAMPVPANSMHSLAWREGNEHSIHFCQRLLLEPDSLSCHAGSKLQLSRQQLGNDPSNAQPLPHLQLHILALHGRCRLADCHALSRQRRLLHTQHRRLELRTS